MKAISWSRMKLFSALLFMVALALTANLRAQSSDRNEAWETVRTESLPGASDAGLTKGFLGRCGDWSAWKTIESGCRTADRCLFQRQKASYWKYERRRQCRRGIDIQTKTRSVCGC